MPANDAPSRKIRMGFGPCSTSDSLGNAYVLRLNAVKDIAWNMQNEATEEPHDKNRAAAAARTSAFGRVEEGSP